MTIRKCIIIQLLLLLTVNALLSCSSSLRSGATAAAGGQSSQDLAKSIVSSLEGDRPIRLAVVRFSPVQTSARDTLNRFGEFFTEQLLSALSIRQSNIRIFERSRLDAIATEHALSLSGFMEVDEARKLASIAPVDYLLTGTYSRLKTTVEINARIIDVVTGEIVSSYTTRLPITEEIASLFPREQTRQAVTVTAEKVAEPGNREEELPCGNEYESVKTLVKRSDTRGLIALLLNVSVDSACGYVHDMGAYSLRKAGVMDPQYRDHLLQGLVRKNDRPVTHICYEILAYCAMDSSIDDKEWKAGLAYLDIADRQIHHNILDELFFCDKNLSGKRFTVQKKRLDEYVTAETKGNVGKEKTVRFSKAFYNACHGFKSRDGGVNPMLIYLFEKYGAQAAKTLDERTVGRVQNFLDAQMFKYGVNTLEENRLVLGWLAALYARLPADKEMAEDLKRLLGQTLQRVEEGKTDSAVVMYAAELLGPFVKKSFMYLLQGSQWSDGIELCLKLGIEVSGFVPSVDSLIGNLSSENSYEKMSAAERLVLYGQRAAPAEAKVLRALRRSASQSWSGTTNFQWSLIRILGNIRTNRGEAIKQLIELLDSRRHKVPDEAVDALAKIGSPVFPYLEKVFPESETGVQIKIVRVFEKSVDGREHANAFLKKVYTTSENVYLRDAAEIALERLGVL